MPDEQQPTLTKKESIRLLILQRTFELLTAAFSLVAALAWNDAIQTLFKQIFGDAQSLAAKFIYAILLTVLIVWLGSRVNKLGIIAEKHLQK